MTGRGAIWFRAALHGFAFLVFAYLVLPVFVIVPMSFSAQRYLSFPPSGWSLQWYESVAANPAWQNAAMNSLVVGLASALLSVVLGTLAALALTRGGLQRATWIVALVLAPMMLPHVIIAIGLYPVVLDLGIVSTRLAVVIGHTVIGTPLVFITVSAALRSYNASLELAAMTLGANWWNLFRHVTFPMIKSGVVVGGLLAFALSFDELILSLFLTGPTTRTLPRLIWEQMNDYLTPSVAAVANLVLVASLLLLAASALAKRRRNTTDVDV